MPLRHCQRLDWVEHPAGDCGGHCKIRTRSAPDWREQGLHLPDENESCTCLIRARNAPAWQTILYEEGLLTAFTHTGKQYVLVLYSEIFQANRERTWQGIGCSKMRTRWSLEMDGLERKTYGIYYHRRRYRQGMWACVLIGWLIDYVIRHSSGGTWYLSYCTE